MRGSFLLAWIGWSTVLAQPVIIKMAPPIVQLPLSFTTQPVSLSVTQGAQLLLSSLAQPWPVIYQWHCNGRALPSETKAELRLSTAMPQDAGDYFCVAFDGTARTTSHVAQVQVVRLPGVTPSFVNFETPVINPIALSPNGAMLAVCNLPDNRLELFDVRSGTPVPLRSVPVGLDPVSVRFRTDEEAWVVNYISDSISVVNVVRGNVVATLPTPDTPADVVFAGQPVKFY